MGTDIRLTIHNAIEKNKASYFAFLKDLISFDSRILEAGKYGQEKGIQDYLKQYFQKLGAQVDAFSPENEKICKYAGFNKNHTYENWENVVAIFKGAGGGRSLLMNGHCDIVPPGDESAWTSPPFTCVERSGRLYGRGTTDMKGGLGAAILAVSLLKELSIPLAGDIIIESVIDEEGGGNGTIACCDRGYRADGAIIMEPTRMAVMPANRGAFLARFTVTGRQTHAATKGLGVNAVEKAIKLINAMKEVETHWLMTKKHPLLSNPTINIGKMEGGLGASIVPEACTVDFDVEFLPSEYDKDYRLIPVDPQDIKDEIQRCIDFACAGDPWLCSHPVTVDWYQETLCFETDAEHPFVQTALKSCRRVLPGAVLDGLPCGCDGAPLFRIGKMPVVIMGPGDLEELHTTDESMDAEKFYQAIEVYANLILDWVGTVKTEEKKEGESCDY